MTTFRLRLSAPPDDVDTVHAFLDAVWQASDVPPMERFRFETALIELTANVIRHASGPGGVVCSLVMEVSDTSLAAEVVDDGVAGDIDLTREMPDDFDESGRGIPLIRALVDEVGYSRFDDANHWRLARTL